LPIFCLPSMFCDLATLPTYHHYQINIEQSTPSREGEVTDGPKSQEKRSH
jgi:hypothetical protein